MGRNVLIAVLIVGMAGLGFWGYSEHRAKNALVIQNENKYQQAFHELSYYVDKIHDNLGASLATNKTSTSSPQLAEVWRLTNSARADIGKLPLGLASFNDTATFLSKLGNFSYQTAIKSPNAKGLSSADYNQLESLYKESGNIENDLRGVQKTILDNNLKWTDVELAVNSKTPRDNQIVDGLQTVNQQVASFEKTLPPTMNNPMGDMKKLNELGGKTIDKGEAIHRVKQFTNVQTDTKASIQKLGSGAGYNGFDLMFDDPSKEESLAAAVTQKGGQVVWYMRHRPIANQKLSLHQAVLKAQQFLKEKGYDNFKEVLTDQYDTVGVISFAKQDHDVLVYPDSIKVKVALDNGEIVGLDQTEHLIMTQTALPSLKPKLSIADAKKGIRESVSVQSEQLVVYKNEQGKETLCYEFLSTRGKDTYRILINANTGVEENVNLLNV